MLFAHLSCLNGRLRHFIRRCKVIKSHIVDTFVLPRINVIKRGLGNNGFFVKEPLSFNMLALKFVFTSC